MRETQRTAVRAAAVFEGLARKPEHVDDAIRAGAVSVVPCSARGSVGSVTGATSYSMAGFLVEAARGGTRTRAFCSLYEGNYHDRINYGQLTAASVARMAFLRDALAPTLRAGLRGWEALRLDRGDVPPGDRSPSWAEERVQLGPTGQGSGGTTATSPTVEERAADEAESLGGPGAGIPLGALISESVRCGDELHHRSTSLSAQLAQRILAGLASPVNQPAAQAALPLRGGAAGALMLEWAGYFGLRVAMAASRACMLHGEGVPGSALLTHIALNSRRVGIRVAGLPDQWFTAPVDSVRLDRFKFFKGFSASDAEFMGGESVVTECYGLGAFAGAAAPALAKYAGGADAMLLTTNEMLKICVGRHPFAKLPVLDGAGSALGVHVHKVLANNITPYIHYALAGKAGGQIGAGAGALPILCFQDAHRAILASLPA